MKLNQTQILGKKIRELRREILHEHNATIRKIYKTHIIFLQGGPVKE